MNDEESRRQVSVYSDKQKAQQKEDLRRAYERDRAELLKERVQLQQELDEFRRSAPPTREQSRNGPASITATKEADREARIRELTENLERTDRKLDCMSDDYRRGLECIDSATVTKGPDGAVTITAPLGPPQPRLHYESLSHSGLESRAGFQKLHTRGAGSGFESDRGICYGSAEVNQQYQRLGIEGFLQDAYRQRTHDTELRVKTVTQPHSGTWELREVQYEIQARKPGEEKFHTVYEVTIQADRNGKVSVSSEQCNRELEMHYFRESVIDRWDDRQDRRLEKLNRESQVKHHASGAQKQQEYSEKSMNASSQREESRRQTPRIADGKKKAGRNETVATGSNQKKSHSRSM